MNRIDHKVERDISEAAIDLLAIRGVSKDKGRNCDLFFAKPTVGNSVWCRIDWNEIEIPYQNQYIISNRIRGPKL
jgi:hypothetical protein